MARQASSRADERQQLQALAVPHAAGLPAVAAALAPAEVDAAWLMQHGVGVNGRLQIPSLLVESGAMTLLNSRPYGGQWRIDRNRVWAKLRELQPELPKLGEVAGTWQDIAAVALEAELDAVLEQALLVPEAEQPAGDRFGPKEDEQPVAGPSGTLHDDPVGENAGPQPGPL